MTATSRSVMDMKCDRCGYEASCDSNATWASIGGQYNSGTGIIPGHYYKADLCPMCIGSFHDWWREKAEEKQT